MTPDNRRLTFWTLVGLWSVFGIAALVMSLIGSIEYSRHSIQATCTIGGIASGGCGPCGREPYYTCQITWKAGSRSGIINGAQTQVFFKNLCRNIPDRYGAIEKCWVAGKGRNTAINQKNRTDCIIMMSLGYATLALLIVATIVALYAVFHSKRENEPV